ncbi:meteorin-like protein [Periplaneta americana]|uniref:meteorin-like protein n=1 Tax=Periplaneta americana TaxID=6978 RepID=UPI0037E7AE3A
MKFSFRLKDPVCSVLLRVVILIVLENLEVDCRLTGSSASLGDGCDWTGSGLSVSEVDDISGRGVTPVYLRCSQGHLEWLYPRGALRVLLRLGASGRDFRGCVKVSGSFSGAHIFLEGPRSLLPLFSSQENGDAPQQLARCFQSRDGQAALYVEATSSRSVIHKQVAAFSYDLQPLPRGRSYYDSQEDCRPCSPDEMIRLYCTSDFVARGIITGVFNNEALARSEIATRVSTVYRQLQPVFKPHNMSAFEYSLQEEMEAFSVVTNVLVDSTTSNANTSFIPRYLYGTLYVPLHCGAKHGPGEFIFMGRFILDDPVLTCAPRLDDWLEVRRMAIQEGSAQCSLET